MHNDSKDVNDHPEEPTMDRKTQDALLESLTPIEPGAQRRVALRTRILQRIGTPLRDSDGFITVRADEGEWIEIAPAVHRKRLLSSGDVVADLIRMAPGSSLPAHRHPEAEECICLEGEVSLGDIVVRAGDFHFAPKGLAHGTIRSRTGCVLYVRTANVARRGQG